MPDGSFSPRTIFAQMANVWKREGASSENEADLVAKYRHPLRQYAREFAELYYDSLAMPEPSKRLVDEFFEGCSNITGNALSARYLKNETDLLLALTNNWGHLRSNDTARSITDEAVSEAYGTTSAGRNEGALLRANASMAHSTHREINMGKSASGLAGRLAKVQGYFESEKNEAKISTPERNAFLAEEFPSLLEGLEKLSSLPILARIEAIVQLIKEERASYKHEDIAWMYLADYLKTSLSFDILVMQQLVARPEATVGRTIQRDKPLRTVERVDADIQKSKEQFTNAVVAVETYQALLILNNKRLTPAEKRERARFAFIDTLSALLPRDIEALTSITDPAELRRIVRTMQADLDLLETMPAMQRSWDGREHRLTAAIDRGGYQKAVDLLEYMTDSISKAEAGAHLPAHRAKNQQLYPVMGGHTIQQSISYINERVLPALEKHELELQQERLTAPREAPITPTNNDAQLESLQQILRKPEQWQKGFRQLQRAVEPYDDSLTALDAAVKDIYERWQYKRSVKEYVIDPTNIVLNTAR